MAKAKPTKMLAILGRCRRSGRLNLVPRSSVLALFGTVHLDMRDATVDGDRFKMQVTVVCGSATFILPEGATVKPSGAGLIAGSTVNLPEHEAESELPTLEIEWTVAFGKIRILDPVQLQLHEELKAKKRSGDDETAVIEVVDVTAAPQVVAVADAGDHVDGVGDAAVTPTVEPTTSAPATPKVAAEAPVASEPVEDAEQTSSEPAKPTGPKPISVAELAAAAAAKEAAEPSTEPEAVSESESESGPEVAPDPAPASDPAPETAPAETASVVAPAAPSIDYTDEDDDQPAAPPIDYTDEDDDESAAPPVVLTSDPFADDEAVELAAELAAEQSDGPTDADHPDYGRREEDELVVETTAADQTTDDAPAEQVTALVTESAAEAGAEPLTDADVEVDVEASSEQPVT